MYIVDYRMLWWQKKKKFQISLSMLWLLYSPSEFQYRWNSSLSCLSVLECGKTFAFFTLTSTIVFSLSGTLHAFTTQSIPSLLQFYKDTWAWWMLADSVAQFLVFKGLLFFSVGGFYLFYDFVHLVLTLTLTKLWDSLALGQILYLKCVKEAYYK